MASTPPPITKASIAKLVGLITNIPAALIEEKMSDAQAQAFALNIGEILAPTEVFPPSDFNPDAVALAASMDPEDVFTGEAGTAKLDAWAIAAGYSKS